MIPRQVFGSATAAGAEAAVEGHGSMSTSPYTEAAATSSLRRGLNAANAMEFTSSCLLCSTQQIKRVGACRYKELCDGCMFGDE